MKVKITGTRGPECWYHNRQGAVFEVAPHCHLGFHTGDWNAGYADDSGKECLIASEDCEELPENSREHHLSCLGVMAQCYEHVPPELQQAIREGIESAALLYGLPVSTENLEKGGPIFDNGALHPCPS